MIKPINRLIKNEREEVPTALKRLPKSILKQYYPRIFQEISHFLIIRYLKSEIVIKAPLK
jgi:hypothetical protein